jgi:hypothetical protein
MKMRVSKHIFIVSRFCARFVNSRVKILQVQHMCRVLRQASSVAVFRAVTFADLSGREGKNRAFYSGCSEFKSRAEDRLHCLSQSLPYRQVLDNN